MSLRTIKEKGLTPPRGKKVGDSSRETPVKHQANSLTAATVEKMEMPDGTGAVVLYRKEKDRFTSVAVIPVKTVFADGLTTPWWTQIENLLMAHQLVLSYEQPFFPELGRFEAYKRAWRRRKIMPEK
ncbi:MAG TPA: hypothetical protein VLC74_03260 [Rhizomicrobium sp.]|nr:hypothetical protein [Rhizomicrobium sp.]